MRRGDVRWAQHPDWPRRPALLLTRDEAIDPPERGVRRSRDDRHSWTAHRGPAWARGRDAGPSVLNADQVASLPKGYLGDLITTLSPERLAEVCRALDHATGC